MRRIVIATAMSLCVVSLAAVASADTLVMRDGTRIAGTMVSMAARTITFRHADGVSRRYPTSQVEAVEFVSAERANPKAVKSGGLEAPAGTELVVRTVEIIDSRNVGADQVFSAIVEQGVKDASGRVIIPEGASAQLMIRQLSSGGKTGSPEMLLDVQSITIEGRRYVVSTTDVALDSGTGIGKNKRTAEAVGGGATAQVLTRGRDVRVPAETVLKFLLDQRVTLRAEQ
jgi:hypothetical protein